MHHPHTTELFFKMVSSFSDSVLDANAYALGLPEDYVSPTVNTSIRLQPLISSSEYFDRSIGYNRAELQQLGIITVNRGDANTLHDLLDQINQEPIFLVSVREQPYMDYQSVTGQVYPEDVINVDIPHFGKATHVDIPMVAMSHALFIKGSVIVRVNR